MHTNSGKIFALGQTGNRLFQLAFAFTSKSCKRIDITFSSEFLGDVELQQLTSLSHQLGIEIVRHRNPRNVYRKYHNLCIRFGSKKRSGQFNTMIRGFLEFWYTRIAEGDLPTPKVVIANGSGDLPDLPEDKDYAVIGYVQNADLLSQSGIKEIFGRAIEESINPGIRNNSELNSNKTVLLQIRLGDYLKDKKIGVCHPTYYSSALESIDLEIGIEQIHLYSNDPESAMNFVPPEFRRKVKIIGNKTETPLEAINQMRNYGSYIISNSTFGWWGAFLSKHENPIVYVPDPWFRKLDEPSGLVPDSWKRIPSTVNYN